jgi:predicted enzyme related to lactoylglutathione lyase
MTALNMIVNVDVDDLEKAVDFYTAGLGLRLSRRLFQGSVAEMVGATSTIHLLLKPAASPATPNTDHRRAYTRHWTPVHLDFQVEDVPVAVERAVHAGARLEGKMRCFGWGRIATLSDPFGHGFCLLQFPATGYDEVADS